MKLRTYIPVLIFVVVCGVALYFTFPAYITYRQTNRTVRRLEGELARQEEDARALRRELTALRTDYRAIERVAREKFGLCREGEKIYHFDPPADDQGDDGGD